MQISHPPAVAFETRAILLGPTKWSLWMREQGSTRSLVRCAPRWHERNDVRGSSAKCSPSVAPLSRGGCPVHTRSRWLSWTRSRSIWASPLRGSSTQQRSARTFGPIASMPSHRCPHRSHEMPGLSRLDRSGGRQTRADLQPWNPALTPQIPRYSETALDLS